MKARTLDGRETEVNEKAVDSLRAALKGPVLRAGDAGYEESRTVWNAMIDKRPALVARCVGTADVMACVRFARAHDLLLCIKGGGHNIAGLATADGALMLDMSLMRGVWVDAAQGVAHAQAGCLLGDVDRETQLHGLAAVLGFISTTGIAGLTLGGGFGYLTRRWGWTADNVRGMDVVTADAQLVHASSNENTDLFWGLRGGSGNFGVVTRIEYVLHPVGPQVLAGIIAWPAEDAAGVCALYRTLAESAPAELSLMLILRPAPPAPWLPKERHYTPIVEIAACYGGSPEAGAALVAPLKSFGTPIGDVLFRRPYTEVQSLLDATQPKGRRNYWKSEFLPGLEPALCEKLVEHAAKIRSPHSSVVLMQIGGALNRVDEAHTPVGNRDARYALLFLGSGEHAAEDAANIQWTREAWADIRRFSTGRSYINFLSADEGVDRLEAALGQGLNRLAEVKARWDPANVFRTNRNVRPAELLVSSPGSPSTLKS